MRVGKGAIGDIAGDLFAQKIATKIPKVGENAYMRHIGTAALAIIAMDSKMAEDFAFGAAIGQVKAAAYNVPAIKSFVGISDELSDELADEVVQSINDSIEADIQLYKGEMSGQGGSPGELSDIEEDLNEELNDEPTFGVDDFTY